MTAPPFLAPYRSPTSILLVVLGLVVAFGGLWAHSGGLVFIGVATALAGHRLVEILAGEPRADLVRAWGKSLDNLRDSTCLLLNLIGAAALLVGFWEHEVGFIFLGLLVAGAGHYYAGRGRPAAGAPAAASSSGAAGPAPAAGATPGPPPAPPVSPSAAPPPAGAASGTPAPTPRDVQLHAGE